MIINFSNEMVYLPQDECIGWLPLFERSRIDNLV